MFVKKTILIFMIISFAVYPKAKNTLEILNPKSARSAAMMNAVFLSGSDSSVIFFNPAMTTSLLRGGISLNYSLTPEIDHRANGSYVYLAENFAFGIGYAVEFNSVKKYNLLGEANGKFTESTHLINLSGAYIFGDGSIGVNLKGIIKDTDKTLNWGTFLDISYVQSIFIPALKVGFAIKNLGVYEEKFGYIDTEAVMGVGFHREDGSFSVTAEYSVAIPTVDPNFALGAEVMIIRFNNFGEPKTSTVSDFDEVPENILDYYETDFKRKSNVTLPSGILARLGLGVKGVSLGIGIYLDVFRIDYAIEFNDYSAKNISHSAGLTFMF